jgi:hypothetical protein
MRGEWAIAQHCPSPFFSLLYPSLAVCPLSAAETPNFNSGKIEWEVGREWKGKQWAAFLYSISSFFRFSTLNKFLVFII